MKVLHSIVIGQKLATQESRREINRAAGRRRNRTGQVGQDVILWRLLEIGVQMVESVNTPWKIKRVGGKIVGAIPMKKVNGDFRGIMPGGQSVLVEVKTNATLPYAAFQDHQRAALDEHHRLGGLSLVGWVCGAESFVMRWPLPGFRPHTSLAIETARQLNWGKAK